MITTQKILILEDDLETVGKLLIALHKIEDREPKYAFDVTTVSTYLEVEDWVNKKPANYYDAILLDRDCKLTGSFHILDFEKFGPEKIISISSFPEWNKQAIEYGVTKVILKNFENLDNFVAEVINELKNTLNIK